MADTSGHRAYQNFARARIAMFDVFDLQRLVDFPQYGRFHFDPFEALC